MAELPYSVASIRSDEEYAAIRNHPTLWLPLIRRALTEAGMANTGGIEMLGPSQYPTALVRDLDLVVTIFSEYWGGHDAYALELEVHALLEFADLPSPTLAAHGMLRPDTDREPWPWLVETRIEGECWTTAIPRMSPRAKTRAATELGTILHRCHDVPHAHSRVVEAEWTGFHDLVAEELSILGNDDHRLASLPSSLRSEFHTLARSTLSQLDTTAPTKLLHGDIHGGNVLLDPATGELTGIIDFNEVRGGEAWYDLADACLRLMHSDPHLVRPFLDAYGVPLDEHPDETALRLLGWALLHDFDVITPAARERGPIQTAITDFAKHLTGIVG